MGILQVERQNDRDQAMSAALESLAAGLWAALPGIVQSYDATKGTVTVQPAIQMRKTQEDGNEVWQTPTILVDCPVVYQGGGGFLLTFPIQPGDECLVIFADRCIDGWWQSGKVSQQADLRMHSLSDGFALIGPISKPNIPANISGATVQLRSHDGNTNVEITAGQVVNVKAPGGCNITGNVTITGNLSVSGTTAATGDVTTQGKVTATGDGVFAGHSVKNHVHSGVQSGGSNTGTAVG